jgi:vacuolar-type H+-ATPase subunit I/STV1
LDIETKAFGPRRFALVAWIDKLAQDVYAALNDGDLSGRDTEDLLDSLNSAASSLYAPTSKKHQMISVVDPFEYDYSTTSSNTKHRQRRAMSLEERRQESRRRWEEDQRLMNDEDAKERQLYKRNSNCRRKRRRLTFNSNRASSKLEDFRDHLNKLENKGRLKDISSNRFHYWMDLAQAIKEQLPNYS